jgi:very-short-patch-repair endonuclease
MTLYYNRTSERGIRKRLRKESKEAEEILWYHLRNRLLNGIKFRRQYSVGKYILDFYSPENKLAVEVDGEIHLNKEVKGNDELREEYIKRFGISILRLTNEMIKEDIKTALKLIEEQIKHIQLIK